MSRQEDKPIAIPLPGGELALEGIYQLGSDGVGGAVIAPPHPLYGGSMDSPVVSELCWACQRAGLATVRFNWRGVGASAGVSSGSEADADADYAAALAYLADSVSGPLVAAGYSFGAAAAVRSSAAGARVERLLLVAPPPGMLDAQRLAGFDGEALALVGEADDLAPAAELEPLFGAEGRQLQRVRGADHFFGAGLSELGRRAAGWLGATD